MFLLGICSLLQLIVLPGFIILRLLKAPVSTAVQLLLYSMGLSLYANYCLVCVLTWLHLYTPPLVFTLFALELAAAILLLWRDQPPRGAARTVDEWSRRFDAFVRGRSPLHAVLFIGACLVLLFFVSLVPFSAGSAYYFSDALMHWTRWPAAWASNAFPVGTSHYPQLFPANLSLIHIFTGDPGLQFFTKALMPAFFIGILLMLADLYRVKRSLVCLAAFFVYTAFLLVFYSILFILEVNADIPVSFFAFLTYYAVLRQDADRDGNAAVILAAVFAAAAADTKLAGMYILAPAGAYIAHWFYSRRRGSDRRTLIRTLGAVVIVGAAGFFWYAVQPAEMIGGLNQSVYLKPDYASRFFGAAEMLYYTLGAPFAAFLIITLALAAADREGRWLLSALVIPPLILWMFFFSVDYRNLSFMIPFASVASAYGVRIAYRGIARAHEENERLRSAPLLGKPIITLVTIAAPMCIFLAAGTDAFFNLCMSFAYALNSFVFKYYRVGYTTELGYYRSVELYRSALMLASAAALAIMVLRRLRVQLVPLAAGACGAAIVIFALLLPDNALKRLQMNDESMTTVRNCYYRVRPYTKSHKAPLVVSNSIRFAGLIPPPGATFVYRDEPYASFPRDTHGRFDACFVLIEKQLQHDAPPAVTVSDTSHHTYSELFSDTDVIFARVHDRMTTGK